jgi:hypothetical protein
MDFGIVGTIIMVIVINITMVVYGHVLIQVSVATINIIDYKTLVIIDGVMVMIFMATVILILIKQSIWQFIENVVGNVHHVMALVILLQIASLVDLGLVGGLLDGIVVLIFAQVIQSLLRVQILVRIALGNIMSVQIIIVEFVTLHVIFVMGPHTKIVGHVLLIII